MLDAYIRRAVDDVQMSKQSNYVIQWVYIFGLSELTAYN